MTDAHGGAGRDESEGHSGTVPKDMSQDRKDSTGMAVPKASQPGGLAGPGLLLGLAAALLFAFPYAEQTRNANERPRLLQGMALVDTGSFAIDGPGGRGLDPGPDVARDPQHGALYPNKPPGASLVAAVAYAGAQALTGAEPLTLDRKSTRLNSSH